MRFTSKIQFGGMNPEYTENEFLTKEDYEEILLPFYEKWLGREAQVMTSTGKCLGKEPISLEEETILEIPREELQNLTELLRTPGIDSLILEDWIKQKAGHVDLRSMFSDLIIKKMLLAKRNYDKTRQAQKEADELDTIKDGFSEEAIIEIQKRYDVLEREARTWTMIALMNLAKEYAKVNNISKEGLPQKIYELNPHDFGGFIANISSGQLQ